MSKPIREHTILITLGFSVVFVLIALLSTTGTAVGDADAADTTVSFKDDVYPIIEEHCLPCHLKEERNMSRLFMDNYEMLMEGGFNGPPIEPGVPDESLLIQKIRPNPPFGDRMPRGSERYLNDDEIAVIEQWIEEGAKEN